MSWTRSKKGEVILENISGEMLTGQDREKYYTKRNAVNLGIGADERECLVFS